MKLFIISLFSYLLGSVPFSYIIARIWRKNLYGVGSGNIGAANVWRATGKIEPAFLALIGDVGKGYLAMYFVLLLHPENLFFAYSLSAFFSVLGHNWPIFLKFKGGKGLATLGGNLLFLDWKILLGGVLIITFFIYLFEFLIKKEIKRGKNYRETTKNLFLIFTSQILGRVVGILTASIWTFFFFPQVFQTMLPAVLLSGVKHIKRTERFLKMETK